MKQNKKNIFIATVCVVFFYFVYNNSSINCFIEDRLPTKFIGIPSLTWVRYIDPRYNFSFSHPACWEVDAQSEGGMDFIDVNKWIRGNLYSILIFQSAVPNANQDPENVTVTHIGKQKIRASYSKIPNDFTGANNTGTTHVGTGYDKVYSFPVTADKNVSIQYCYEQTVNGKRYTEPDIGREVADRVVQSVLIENSPLWKYISYICPKCGR